MESEAFGDEDHGSQSDALLQMLLRDYRDARVLLEELTGNFRLKEALLADRSARVANASHDVNSTLGLMSARRTIIPASAVALFCLGRFRVEMAGKTVDIGTGGKSLAVLKFLAGRGRRPTPRDLLLEALWPDSEAEAANNRLRVAVHGLRRLLASVDESLDFITYQEGCYAVNPGLLIWIDADEFEALWRRGIGLERQGFRGEAAQVYAEAELLYRGDYLEEDLYEEWTLLRRESLRDAYMDLLGKLANWSLAEEDYGNCIVQCQKILAQDTCREDAYRLLMLCHAATGQRSRALRWYEICAATLRRELDIAPSPETVSLHRRLLRGEPVQGTLPEQ